MIYLYDNAILDKFKRWFNDPSLTITGPDDKLGLWTYRADESTEDRIKLPMIGLSRMPDIEIDGNHKKRLSYGGKIFNNQAKNNVSVLNAIPISIAYQLDVYTRKRIENDNILKELTFKLINNPQLFIEIPYNSNMTHAFTLNMESTITDNSDIPEHLIKGEYFRTTYNLYVIDGYLFDYKTKDLYSIEVDVDIVESDNEIKGE